MNSLEAALQGKDTTTRGDLHVSFELGDRSWKLSCSDGVRSPSRYSVNAGDQAAVLDWQFRVTGPGPDEIDLARRGIAGVALPGAPIAAHIRFTGSRSLSIAESFCVSRMKRTTTSVQAITAVAYQ